MLVLAGRHVRLEPLTVDHAEPLVAAATEPGAAFHWTDVPTRLDEMRSALEAQLALAAGGTWMPFATVVPASGNRVVGSTSFLEMRRWAPFGRSAGVTDPIGSVEIGATWLAPSARAGPAPPRCTRS